MTTEVESGPTSGPPESHPAAGGEPLLRLEGIDKNFGAVQALLGVDLDVPAGQVTALAGDNGAGKSVLIKCIAGIHSPDGGRIFWEGRPVHIRTSREAAALGIETVYQDLAPCDNLDIVQNMFLGRERVRRFTLDEEDMERAARETLTAVAALFRRGAPPRRPGGGTFVAPAGTRAGTARWFSPEPVSRHLPPQPSQSGGGRGPRRAAASADRRGRRGRDPAGVGGALPARPTAHVTLGTAISNADQEVLATIVAGLRDEPLNLVVTVGPGQDPSALGPQPATVVVERYVSHALLLPRCDLVISHGGAGTVLAALGHGLPLLTMPQGADQYLNAEMCALRGVGRTLLTRDLSSESAREQALIVLGDPGYRESAREVRSEIAGMPPPEDVVEILHRI